MKPQAEGAAMSCSPSASAETRASVGARRSTSGSYPARAATIGLTKRRRQALDAIRAFIAREGVAPTRLELCDLLGLKSNCAVQWLINRLVDSGHLRRLPHRARAIELISPFPTGVRRRECLDPYREAFAPAFFIPFGAAGDASPPRPILMLKRPGEVVLMEAPPPLPSPMRETNQPPASAVALSEARVSNDALPEHAAIEASAGRGVPVMPG